MGSLLYIPQTNGVLAAGSKWFIQKFGKLVGNNFSSSSDNLLCALQVGIYLGPQPSVLCYDYEIAKEMFNQDISAGRPNTFVYRFRMLGKKYGSDGDYANVFCKVS